MLSAMEIDKDIELINLGKRVKEIRLSKNLTQFDLAVRVNKDQQSIHRLEAGKINPSYIYLLEVCQGLDIPVTEIFNNKEL
ncbi:helix-turn-helix transcriptional regulator [Aequorivita lipolytica]|uniref:Helix-turn-helix transcriptional regulator n=1 Tax=Aequorivita lipolytica TaxID=153267 RepID=A0A5C6YMK0_9FLAO|nr:helix-turn-helix transcriptional regulator [Aequorivita lipolytica]TXD68083.1 helix-turn-helix transcriptional regulator [Aequorivita lipolytica]SRX53634.1 hypothetical protein AEQU2_02866 [Aequorivita lipolytica]